LVARRFQADKLVSFVVMFLLLLYMVWEKRVVKETGPTVALLGKKGACSQQLNN
jgi:hypothetical protein